MNKHEHVRPINILLVEDNPGDVELTVEALKECKIYNNLMIAWNGVEAIEILRFEGKYADAPQPDIILLDLNLPKKNGHEVLAEIKNDPILKRIPVMILTSSQSEEDILRTYDNYANCYITKPLDLDQLNKIVKSFDDFWFSIVELPPK